ncbi:MgtE Mg/Co/Ni transporter MgtE (contains CBS domain) [Fimbriimonadaceae bacterium]
MRTDVVALIERVEFLLETEGVATLIEELEDLHAEDIAQILERLEESSRVAILEALEPELASYVLIELPTEIARGVVNLLPDTTVANYLDILPMDDAIDIREHLDHDRFEALLNVIPREDADEIRRLLSYPVDSAGQLMTEDFVEVGPAATMEDVLSVIREASGEYETVNYIYVLSEDRHLLGVLTLRRVLRSQPSAIAREVMNEDPITVPVEMPEEEVARVIARYGFSAVPVLDSRGRMVGIVTADDAQEVLEEAETEDVLAMGGVFGDAESYFSLSTAQLVKRRLPWLMFLFLAEFFTGTVLRHYTLEAAEAGQRILAQLMLFVPLLIGAGGNAGSQVTTTITRALALGEVSAKDWFMVVRRELVVAVVIGVTLGVLGFLRAFLPVIGWSQPISLSIIVGIALPVIIVWAAAVGSLLPIGAKAIKQDPAVMSAPFISTFVDATGLIIYFEIAILVLRFYGLQLSG